MKHQTFSLFSALMILIAIPPIAHSSTLDPHVTELLQNAPEDTLLDVALFMAERPPAADWAKMVAPLERNEQSSIVWEEVVRFSNRTQASLLKCLHSNDREVETSSIKQLRIANGVTCRAKPAFLKQLAMRPDLWYIRSNDVEFFEDEETTCETSAAQNELNDSATVPWFITRINVPYAWELHAYGQGVLVASLDTGINADHTDFSDCLWGHGGYPNHGYDFHNDDNDPDDTDGHGSHVVGVIAGNGTSGIKTGVAPRCEVMILKVRETLSAGQVTNAWQAHDLALQMGADVTSMSLGWGHPPQSDRVVWRDSFNVLSAAGITNVKSAGNRRRTHIPPIAISIPGDIPSPWRNPDEIESGTRGGLITVGAVDANNIVADFSSPGPVTWMDIFPWEDYRFGENNAGLIKPDVCAPGTDGNAPRFSRNDGYSSFSGTSMAQPHVAGAVALMLSASPWLTPVLVDSILQTTAYDLGPDGKDNDYGAGLIDALRAVQIALLSAPEGTSSAQPFEFSIQTSPNPFNASTTVALTLQQQSKVTITIHNVLGEQVSVLTNSILPAGNHRFSWDATDFASGVYFVRCSTPKKNLAVSKVVLLR